MHDGLTYLEEHQPAFVLELLELAELASAEGE